MSRKLWTEAVSTKQEDLALIDLIKKFGTQEWYRIASELRPILRGLQSENEERTPKQCKDRWMNYLDPNIKTDDWCDLETQALFEAQKIHGNRWVKIAALIPGRTESDVKNQFYSTIRRNVRKLIRDAPDDPILRQPIQELLRHPSYSKMILDYTSKGIYKKYTRKKPLEKSKCTEPIESPQPVRKIASKLPRVCEIKYYYAARDTLDAKLLPPNCEPFNSSLNKVEHFELPVIRQRELDSSEEEDLIISSRDASDFETPDHNSAQAKT